MNLRKTGILLAWAMIIAANGTAQNVQRTSQGIKYAAQGMNVSVEFYSPSIDSYFNATAGKYGLVELSTVAGG